MRKNHSVKKFRIGVVNGKLQSFSIAAPAAASVQLVGDFTCWQHDPILMQKGEQGVWHAQVELTPGEHPYRFLVDGQWCDDPHCEMSVPNPFGGQNSVCCVT